MNEIVHYSIARIPLSWLTSNKERKLEG